MQESDVWDGRDLGPAGSGLRLNESRVLEPFRFVVMGPPGSGKRMQAALLGERLGAQLLTPAETELLAEVCASGERDARLGRRKSTRNGKNTAFTDLVHAQDDEAPSWLRADTGFTLEGFPRTIDEAGAFIGLLRAAHIDLTAVLYYELSVDWAISRLANSRRCRDCGAVSPARRWPERQAAVCEHCGGVMRRSAREEPQRVRERFVRYELDAAPVLDYFADLGVLLTIEAEGCPEEVFQRTEFKLSNVLPAMA